MTSRIRVRVSEPGYARLPGGGVRSGGGAGTQRDVNSLKKFVLECASQWRARSLAGAAPTVWHGWGCDRRASPGVQRARERARGRAGLDRCIRARSPKDGDRHPRYELVHNDSVTVRRSERRFLSVMAYDGSRWVLSEWEGVLAMGPLAPDGTDVPRRVANGRPVGAHEGAVTSA